MESMKNEDEEIGELYAAACTVGKPASPGDLSLSLVGLPPPRVGDSS